MKKIYNVFLLLAALCIALPVSANKVTVSSKADFEAAFKATTNDQIDTIFVKTSNGAWLQPTNGFKMPVCGTFHIIGVNDEETGAKSKLSIQFNMPTNTDADRTSVFFENLDMMCTGGRTASSKYFVNAKDTMYHYMDTLAFIGCEIYDYNRALFRIEPDPKTGRSDGTASLGEIQCFIFENCIVRDGYTQTNPYPFLNLSMPITDLIFRNNLFYNMAYVNCLFTFVNMTDLDTKLDMNFTFENNTVIARSNNTLLNCGTFAGQMSDYEIHDNIFMCPSWKDDFNNLDIADSIIAANPDTLNTIVGKSIASIMYGIGSISNNLIHGYKPASNYIDADGEGEWSVEIGNYYSMEDLEFSWETFGDYKNGDFSYLSSEKIATAGIDGGPLGATWLVKYLENPCVLTTAVSAEQGSVNPSKGTYEKGESVTVTANEEPGVIFVEWQDGEGKTVSTENPYTFEITSDIQLKAVYQIMPVAKVNITLSAPEGIEMVFTPQQDVYYIGDQLDVTFNTHLISDFQGWSDGVSEMNRHFNLTEDVNLTASFDKANFIVIWDFDQITKGKQTMDNGVAANHYVDTLNMGALHTAYFVEGAYKDSSIVMTRNNKFANDLRLCAVRETPAERFAATPDYNYITFSTLGYKNVAVSSAVGVDAKAHKVQNLEYSLDGVNYTKFGSVTVDTVGVWFPLAAQLPAETADQELVYVRWIGDLTSEVVCNPDNLANIDNVAEFSCVAQIKVTAEDATDRPDNGYYVSVGETITDGKQITSVPGITMIYGGAANNWAAGAADDNLKAATDGLFVASTKGDNNNPKTKPTPTTGTYYVFNPSQNGQLTIAVVLNADKSFYITEGGVALPGYDGMRVSEKYYGTYTIDVEAGKSYYVFVDASKLGFGGFIFNAVEGLNKNAFRFNAADAPIYDIFGRRVMSIDNMMPDRIYIQAGRKFIFR